MGATGIELLARCQLFIFDLDGTLYEETSQFAHFGEELMLRLPFAARATYERNVRELLHRLDACPRDGAAPLDDPWRIYQDCAQRLGLNEADTMRAFLATRAFMASAEFPMSPLPWLRESILALTQEGVTAVLITNSPEECSRAILAKLNLEEVFHRTYFNADKPRRVTDLFWQLRADFGVPYYRMVSIGDNFVNEINPALSLGMQTVYVDRYQSRPNNNATVTIPEPRRIAELLVWTAALRHTSMKRYTFGHINAN